MTNLVETERWEDGIYQLETSDPVVGGPEGIDNLQAKQLANRTRYLKKAVEARQSDFDAHVAAVDPHPQYATHADLAEKLAALVAQSPETLDTFSELAKALGNDPNFATTITNQLALKAPLDSPIFTGTPKGTTAPQFDSSARLTTNEFLLRALGNFNLSSGTGTGISVAATALTNDDIGGFHYFNGAASQTATLPSETGLPPGAAIAFQRGAQAGLTIGTKKANAIIDTTAGLASSITLIAGEFVVLVWSGTYWQAFGTYTQRMGQTFASSLGTTGYQKLSGGMIFQWVTGGSDANGNMNVTLPIAFPNAVLGGIANEGFPGGWGVNTTTIWAFDIAGSTLSTALARVRSIDRTNGPSSSSGIAGRIFCWGK
ncbi:gp53-like domain-containing protein (plasmid) [Burkholderia ambifaria]